MAQGAVVQSDFRAAPVPLVVRFVSKLVLEVLPAMLASVIGGVLFAHCQFAHPAMLQTTHSGASAATESPEMVKLVRDEHDLIRDFLQAQAAAEKNRFTAANVDTANAVAQAKLAEAAAQRAAIAVSARKTAERNRPTEVAAVPAGPASAKMPTVLIEADSQAAGTPPLATGEPPAPLPVHRNIVAQTLALPGHVVAATLHAVGAIGGLPSWIGSRFGGTPGAPGTPS